MTNTTPRPASHLVTLASDGATVLATVTDADGVEVATFTTKDSDGLVGRIDRQLGAAGYRRAGYNLSAGRMVAAVDARFAR